MTLENTRLREPLFTHNTFEWPWPWLVMRSARCWSVGCDLVLTLAGSSNSALVLIVTGFATSWTLMQEITAWMAAGLGVEYATPNLFFFQNTHTHTLLEKKKRKPKQEFFLHHPKKKMKTEGSEKKKKPGMNCDCSMKKEEGHCSHHRRTAGTGRLKNK